MANNLVQYVVVRGDLMRVMNWPLGAVIAQACHACSAVLHLFHDDENMLAYLSDLDNMHKVVLEAKNDECLRELETKLLLNNIKHKLWIEQPENIPTCLVILPYPKKDVQKYVAKLKLLK